MISQTTSRKNRFPREKLSEGLTSVLSEGQYLPKVTQSRKQKDTRAAMVLPFGEAGNMFLKAVHTFISPKLYRGESVQL